MLSWLIDIGYPRINNQLRGSSTSLTFIGVIFTNVNQLVNQLSTKLTSPNFPPTFQPPALFLRYYWGSNCIHSSMSANCTAAGRCSTSFPSGPSWSATFDRELMRSMAGVVGRETRAFFNMGNFTDNGKTLGDTSCGIFLLMFFVDTSCFE